MKAQYKFEQGGRGYILSSVKHFVFDDGERYPVLVDEFGVPDFWMTLFVTAEIRSSSKASSMENTIRDILHLRLWEEIECRDLVDELCSGSLPTPEDINRIRDHCLLNARELKAELDNVENSKITVLSMKYPIAKRKAPTVRKHHFRNRLSHIARYIEFIGKSVAPSLNSSANFRAELENIIKLLRAQGKKVQRNSQKSLDPGDKAPSPDVFERFLHCVSEDSLENPYKNPDIRLRNYLMFQVMDNTGFRASEILGLHIEDIDFQHLSIRVERRHDLKYDPRSRQPVQKTLGRTIELNSVLMEKLRKYIFYVRSKVPGANKHPFIFVTHKKGEYQGRPISDSTFRNRILKPATLSIPELFQEIKRHGFRHNYNYRICKRIESHNSWVEASPEQAKSEGKKKISSKEAAQILMYLCGWSSEKSAQIYNLRYIKECADKLMYEDQLEQAEKLRGEQL